MEALKCSLRERYIETYKEFKKFKYFPRAFLDMVVSGEDIIDVTRRLIYKEGGTSGFATLFACKRMDLSVERIILEPQYRVLFTTEDLRAAYDRLAQYEYEDLAQIEAP